jgi:hypothetical protein
MLCVVAATACTASDAMTDDLLAAVASIVDAARPA